MTVSILILAAGQSSRMRGVDKLLQDIDGQSILRRTAAMACNVAKSVLLALPQKPHPRWDEVADLAVKPIGVADAVEGINASLRAGLSAVPPECSAVMILLADLPEITESDLRTVIQSVDLSSEFTIWRGTTQDGKPGHPVIFGKSLFPDLLALTGDAGAQSVVRAHADRTKLIALPGHHARLDLDTPEDWDTWRRTRAH